MKNLQRIAFAVGTHLRRASDWPKIALDLQSNILSEPIKKVIEEQKRKLE
jgi:hypothetical protein